MTFSFSSKSLQRSLTLSTSTIEDGLYVKGVLGCRTPFGCSATSSIWAIEPILIAKGATFVYAYGMRYWRGGTLLKAQKTWSRRVPLRCTFRSEGGLIDNASLQKDTSSQGAPPVFTGSFGLGELSRPKGNLLLVLAGQWISFYAMQAEAGELLRGWCLWDGVSPWSSLVLRKDSTFRQRS